MSLNDMLNIKLGSHIHDLCSLMAPWKADGLINRDL